MKYFLILNILTIHSNFLQAKLLDKTVATVNHKMIFLNQLNSTKKEIKNSNLPDSLRDLLYKNKNLLKNKKILLDYLITRQLIFNTIQKYGLKVDASKVNSYVEKIRKNYKLSRLQFTRLLKEKNIVFSQYKKNIKSKLEINQFLRQFISPQINITQTEVYNYLKKKHQQLPPLEKKYELLHIVTQKKKLNQEKFTPWIEISYSEMSKKIKHLLKKIKKKGRPQFIKIANSYHLVKIKSVTKIKSSVYLKKFSKAKTQLFDIRFKSALKRWVKKEKKEAQIKIFL